MPRPVLMSYQPEWAKSVLMDGTQFELRRKQSGCEPGSSVLVYASKGVKKLVGVFEVGQVLSGSLPDLWSQVAGRCGVSEDDFYFYLDGLETGYAIEVLRPRLITPIALGFRGPMSFRYLNVDVPEHARLLTAAGV